MARTVLVHVNVQVPDDDPRTAEDVERAVQGALDVGSDEGNVMGVFHDLVVEIVLCEEV
jgi:hypothetical protein